MSAGFVAWAVETLIASTILMAIVLAIRAPVRAAFGPAIAYALWAIPAIRMILPPDILPRFWPEAANPIADAGAVIYIVDYSAPATAAAAVAEPVWTWPMVVAALWLIGGAAFVAWQLIAFVRLRHRLLDGATETARIGGVRVVETRGGEGPLAFGILDRYVAFPADFRASYDAREQDLALAHELAHHQRGDLIANAAALAMLALHWFNPLAWRAFRAFRADQEMACDARVIAADPAIRHAYGLAIVKSARGGTLSAACHLHTIEQLKGRLKMLNVKAKSKSRRMIGAFAATGLAAVTLAATASGTKASAAIEQASERVVSVLAAPPAPPAPPTPMAAVAPLAPLAPLTPLSAQTAPTPPAPPTPPAILRDEDGMVIKNFRVIRRRDGKTVGLSDAELAEIERSIPDIVSRDCKDGEGGDVRKHVINRRDGTKRMTIICTNRIQKMSQDAARLSMDADKISREAMRGALAGLETARASIERAEMSETDRAEALAGLDEARRELEAERGGLEAELRRELRAN